MASCGAPRTEFPEHPYERPYAIQTQFMRELWQTLQNSQIGLFESPTGTGKTISIICGALHWLEDFRAQQAQEALAGCGGDDDTPDWLREAAVAAKKAEEPEAHPWLRRPGHAAAQLGGAEHSGPKGATMARLGGWTERRPPASAHLKGAAVAAAAAPPPHGAEAEGDDEFLLQPTSAEAAAGGSGGGGLAAGGGAGGLRRPRPRGGGGALGDSSGGSSGDEGGGDEASLARAALRALRAPPGPPPPRRRPQVFFASRTHSQLAQFVGELRKTGFASRLRLVSLAGRRGLCVHEPVAALGAAGLINERCTELQERNKGGSKARKTASCSAGGGGGGGCSTGGGCSSGGAATAGRPRGARKAGGGGGGGGGGACPFLSPSLEEAEAFAHEVVAAPMDVEDLARSGRRRRLCPYYGARSLLPEADVVALPYSALLCADTRAALGLQLAGAVVVFDEAHNLADAVTGSHGAVVTAAQLATAKRQLAAYFERFQLRLSPGNARSLQLLLRLAAALERSLAPPPPAAAAAAPAASPPAPGQPPQAQPQPHHHHNQQQSQAAEAAAAAAAMAVVVPVGEFLVGAGLEHVNLFPLLSWARDSRLVMKVAGYDLASTPAAAGDTAAAAAAAAGSAAATAAASATASAQAALLDLQGELADDHDEEADLDPDLGEGRVGLAGELAAARRRGGAAGAGRKAATAAAASAATAAGTANANANVVAVAAATAGGFGARRSALFAFVSFLSALTHPSADGRIVISRGGSSTPGSGSSSGGSSSGGCLRYTVLNAAAQFAGVVAAARSVVLASGTLSPVQGLVAQLLPGVPPSRLRHFSCGHVVPPRQLAALVAARGPTGLPLQLSHGRRGEPRVMEELGRLLVNICTAVPAGVVVFAPSFAYLDQLVGAWQRSGVYGALAARKRLFLEPRGAGQVEAVLQEYAATIRSCSSSGGGAGGSSSSSSGTEAGVAPQQPQQQWPAAAAAPRRRLTGALLLCVVGGKLSEGINFGDDLGRCVVVLGLPYPNPSDPELRERMRYLDEAAAAAAPAAAVAPAAAATAAGAAGATAGDAAAAAAAAAAAGPAPPRLTGRQYYAGLCIKAVNQCVGRVIRHARDYAAVVLVDERYLPPPHFQPPQQHTPTAAAATSGGGGEGGGGGAVIGSLPRWVLSSLRTSPQPGVTGSFPHVYASLTSFFRSQGPVDQPAAAAAAAATAAAAAPQ
ncbi:hypothetical protein HXX76_003827 [Chlamydomonas incerta]|uniref:Helicase ATP-binding domain-containing protein n=1 Tax=Chlamydomonas incerta TaxID=51695 RepID=A0A835TIF2_CHLIN|nr:hypothetical protein HXX76_003827 [Chlamydomonas incerta]|eukprot:KAG2440974.1 hypothetical protein HXX76_003827 [Chlamydomonas incerta]